MTLNTFHFAGRGEMNVTLGIPRLREILMVASANIKTPSMEIPFCSHVSDSVAEKLRLFLTQVCVSEVLEYVEVKETVDKSSRSRFYDMKFCYLSHKEYRHKFCVTPSMNLSYFEKSFLRNRLLPGLRKAGKMKKETGIMSGKDVGNRREDDEDQIDLFSEAQKKGMGEHHESSDEEPEVSLLSLTIHASDHDLKFLSSFFQVHHECSIFDRLKMLMQLNRHALLAKRKLTMTNLKKEKLKTKVFTHSELILKKLFISIYCLITEYRI